VAGAKKIKQMIVTGDPGAKKDKGTQLYLLLEIRVEGAKKIKQGFDCT
jgi:hypothetical protein